MAELRELDHERVRLWLFAICAQEELRDTTMRANARRLAAGSSHRDVLVLGGRTDLPPNGLCTPPKADQSFRPL